MAVRRRGRTGGEGKERRQRHPTRKDVSGRSKVDSLAQRPQAGHKYGVSGKELFGGL